MDCLLLLQRAVLGATSFSTSHLRKPQCVPLQALMLAAAADCGPGCQALLVGAATLELADALGRTALMFAAGNDACNALTSLLETGASVCLLLLTTAACLACPTVHRL